MKDPIVEEVRKVRKQIEKECEERGETLFEHYLKIQEQYKDRLAPMKPKPRIVPLPRKKVV